MKPREGVGWCLFFAIATAVAFSDGPQVQPLNGDEKVLQEGQEIWTRSEGGKSKVWAKTGKVPPQTDFFKTIKGYEHHGKCRYACYQESTCGGYSWTPATHTCKLFAAPNFLVSPFSNDKWHQSAAQVTGKKYKKDQSTGKAQKKLAIAKKVAGKKTKPIHKRAKTVNGHVHLGLEKIANKALKRSAKSAKGPGKGAKMNIKLKISKSKLYSEFVDKYKHEYTKRAENKIKKRAQSIADKRVKRLDKKHKKKITKAQELAIYKQAKKEVEGHAVRQIQRRFKKQLKAWVNRKVFAKNEQLRSNKRHKQSKKAKKKAAKKKAKKAQMKSPIKVPSKKSKKKKKRL